MSTLHWICALTLALVCCLSAQPVKRSADEKLMTKNNIEKGLKNFRKVAKDNCPNDTEIYSPTDIRGDCLYSALHCTQLELYVLNEECNLTKDEDLNAWLDLTMGLEKAMEIYSPTDIRETPKSPSSCSCESYNQTDVQQFLDALQTLVQQLPM